MRQTLLHDVVAGGAIALLLAFASPSYAETVQFKADLKGSAEVPPNQTTGSGTITATYDTSTKQLAWDGSYSGLTGPATAAHFHGPAEIGQKRWRRCTNYTSDKPFARLGNADRRSSLRPYGGQLVRQYSY